MKHEDIIRDLEISRAENELKLSIRSNDKDFYMQNLSAISKAIVHIREQKIARDKELIIVGVIAAQLLIVIIGLLMSSCSMERYAAKRMSVQECRKVIYYSKKAVEAIDSNDTESVYLYNDSISVSMVKIKSLCK